MADRTIPVVRWGGSPDPAQLHVRSEPAPTAPEVGAVQTDKDPIAVLFLPYVQRARLSAPDGAIHEVVLYASEARELALALLEMAGHADGGALWRAAD